MYNLTLIIATKKCGLCLFENRTYVGKRETETSGKDYSMKIRAYTGHANVTGNVLYKPGISYSFTLEMSCVSMDVFKSMQNSLKIYNITVPPYNRSGKRKNDV